MTVFLNNLEKFDHGLPVHRKGNALNCAIAALVLCTLDLCILGGGILLIKKEDHKEDGYDIVSEEEEEEEEVSEDAGESENAPRRTTHPVG